VRGNTLEDFRLGAELERELRTLKPGQCLDVSRQRFNDIIVPANPLDRQTPEYLAEWFKIRMPFYCETRLNIMSGTWTFERPKLSEDIIREQRDEEWRE